jgi:hypothetical protein
VSHPKLVVDVVTSPQVDHKATREAYEQCIRKQLVDFDTLTPWYDDLCVCAPFTTATTTFIRSFNELLLRLAGTSESVSVLAVTARAHAQSHRDSLCFTVAAGCNQYILGHALTRHTQ